MESQIAKCARGNSMPLQEFFGETLARFELRSRPGRAKRANPAG